MKILVAILWTFVKYGVHADVKSYDFTRSSLLKDILPTNDLDTIEEQTLKQCANLCGEVETCQTFFYKPFDEKCFLYKSAILNSSSVVPESGVSIYEMKGCPIPDFTLFREGGICFKAFTTANTTSVYANDICAQHGGELIVLDTEQKLSYLKNYVFQNFYVGSVVYALIGLNNSGGSWHWVNGAPLMSSTLFTNMINNYDAQMHPCGSSYCGILSVTPAFELNIHDGCCLNTPSLFLCSTPIGL